jgi:excisionase family DNA binding protein
MALRFTAKVNARNAPEVIILHEAASCLGISKMTVVRLIKDGVLPAKQTCIGAPYVIREADLEPSIVRRAIKT